MDRPARTVLTLAVIGLVVPLSGCNSWSATCDTANNCEVSMQGSTSHPYPRPFATADGTKSKDSKDRILLVSATQDGEAVIRAGGVDNTCVQGATFQVLDTTITCVTVGDDMVELTSTRP